MPALSASSRVPPVSVLLPVMRISKDAVRYLSLPDRSKDLLQDPRGARPLAIHFVGRDPSEVDARECQSLIPSAVFGVPLPSIVLRSVYFNYEGLGQRGMAKPRSRLCLSPPSESGTPRH